jgi:hypothetical protein
LPALSYEVFARSDLFLNMVVVAWLIHSGKELERSRGWRLLLWGMAWGLMLSTRGIVILPLIFSGLYLIKGRDWKNKGGFALVLGLTTFLTFVPFYLWDPQLFWLNNPLDVQSGYIPSWALAFVILTCIGIGIRFCFGSRLFFHTGFSIFITVLGCYILKSIQMGWITALWENIFDITYFSMSIPFLILSLCESLA